MQKIVKYIIIGLITIFLFGTGYVAGCISSNRTSGELESENTELRESISEYSGKLESSEQERSRLIGRIRDFESEAIEIVDLGTEIETGFRELHGERSDIGQGIQEVRDGLNGLDSEIRSYIERAENP